jgi:uncharacterized membrane protein YhaH (DUF805 family)
LGDNNRDLTGMFDTFTWYFLSLRGRVSRQEFRLGYFGLVIVNALLIRTFYGIAMPRVRYYSGHDADHTGGWVILMVLIIILWPLTAVFVKRLHDLNVSGWWMLAAFAIAPVSSATNISVWIIMLLVVAILSLLPGTSGHNRFGNDPRERAGM